MTHRLKNRFGAFVRGPSVGWRSGHRGHPRSGRRGRRRWREDTFCHHFADVSAFSARLLEHWEKRSTEDLIAAADASRTPAERRAQLHAQVRSVASGIEPAIQAWALRDPAARAVRARVDARRIGYLVELRRAAGAAPKLTQRMAQIEYGAFLGAIQIFGLPSPEGWKA